MATKAHKDKIGKISFTAKQKEIIAVGVESEFFKIMEDVFLPKQLVKIAVASLNMSDEEKDLWFFKGRAHEASNMINTFRRVAKEYNATNGDADTEGIDPV